MGIFKWQPVRKEELTYTISLKTPIAILPFQPLEFPHDEGEDAS